MIRRLGWLVLLIPLVVTIGCGDDESPSGTMPALPSQPRNVQVVISSRTVTITWDPAYGGNSYTIYWNTTGGVTTSDAKFSSVTSPFVHSNLTNGTTYYYIVTSTNDVGEGPPTNQLSATPQPDQVTLPASKDNTLYEDAAGQLSNGAGKYMFAGVTRPPPGGGSGEPAEIRRAVIAFDVSAAAPPAGATIDSVRLTLHMSRTIGPAPDVTLHRLTADWGEAGSLPFNPNEGGGGTSEPGDATWIHTFFNTQFWTNPGGDFDPVASATTQVGGVGWYTWGSTAAMVADVVGWLNAPATNFGWILIGDETSDTNAKRFDARTSGAPPTLTIFYTGP